MRAGMFGSGGVVSQSYEQFLEQKARFANPGGFNPADPNPNAFDFQKQIINLSVKRGRSAVFADCGLGKTIVQLDWSRQCVEHTGKPAFILSPLAVSEQTSKEAEKFGMSADVAVDGADVSENKIYITNYQKLHRFDPSQFGSIVLDESSILKSFDGKTRRLLTEFASDIKYKLCCTATPAPNDLVEITNHAEFLGVASGKEILAQFFTQDGNTTHKWRLKGHAEDDFWRWLASWSVALRHPRDIGCEQNGFDLPPLKWHEHVVDSDGPPPGLLFEVEARGMLERRQARRASLNERVAMAAEIVAAEPDEQWILWCDLNAESDALAKAIPGAVEVRGSDNSEDKAERMLAFSAGDLKYLVTKPSIAGHGLNWQNCARMIFVGLSDSYEALYQATRRCWRFGQDRTVDAHIVVSAAEGSVLANIKRKERQSNQMFNELIGGMGRYQMDEIDQRTTYTEDEVSGDDWSMLLGDSIERIKEVEDESVGLTLFSPPFPGMYAYTDSPRDVGNVRNHEELIQHFGHLIPDLLRVTMPGRQCCIHLAQEPVFKKDAGHVGLRDFRGSVIHAMESDGWIYYGEVTIDKNPQIKAARTKEQTLLFKTLSTDSSAVRPALADYLLIFRKPGDNPDPIKAGSHAKYNQGAGWVSSEEWIEWAAPVWYRAIPEYPGGIRETDVLNVAQARDPKDERHLCPLQLGVCERAIKLWSNPGDLVLSPFAGVGSEGVVALRFDRRFVGIELKPSYWKTAAKNLEATATAGREQLRIPTGG